MARTYKNKDKSTNKKDRASSDPEKYEGKKYSVKKEQKWEFSQSRPYEWMPKSKR